MFCWGLFFESFSLFEMFLYFKGCLSILVSLYIDLELSDLSLTLFKKFFDFYKLMEFFLSSLYEFLKLMV